MEKEEKHKEPLVWAAGTDPVSQASFWTPLALYGWQANIFRDMVVPGVREAVVTPNESGKTAVVIPVLGLSWMAAFPGAQVVSTSGVERQITEELWPVLRAALGPYPEWQITTELKITAPRVRGLPPATWTAFTTKDPNYAEGFHSRTYRDRDGNLVYAPLLIIIDEAKSITQDMFDAFTRCDPDAWLVISTSGEDSGPFFSCFSTLRGDPWKCREIGWDDCPHLKVGRKLETRQALIRKRGLLDPFVMSFVFGKFFRGGGRVVFENLDRVRNCMNGLVPWQRGRRKAALDFSGGGDEAVYAAADGNMVIRIEGFHEKDTTILGDKFLELLRRDGVRAEDVMGDNGGLGKPIIDYMERKGFRGIGRYMGDDKARDSTQFVNRAAEDAFHVKDLFDNQQISCPNDPVLFEQIRRRQYVRKNDDSNKIRLEPKDKVRDRGEPSPDRLDTITMLLAESEFEILPEYQPEKDFSRCGDPRERFRKREEEDDGETGRFGRTYFQE